MYGIVEMFDSIYDILSLVLFQVFFFIFLICMYIAREKQWIKDVGFKKIFLINIVAFVFAILIDITIR